MAKKRIKPSSLLSLGSEAASQALAALRRDRGGCRDKCYHQGECQVCGPHSKVQRKGRMECLGG